ncbi:hypothetical protein BS47DRAFT_1310197, partial [Hydnum rufescens UP504]
SGNESDTFVYYCAQAEGNQTINPLNPDETCCRDCWHMSCFACKGQLCVTVSSTHEHILRIVFQH